MKLIVAFAAVTAVVTTPALAQIGSTRKPAGTTPTYQYPSPNSSTPSYGSGSSQRIQRPVGPPEAEGFKPFKPYQGASPYASPKTPSYGAKPCETSVYVNACDKRR